MDPNAQQIQQPVAPQPVQQQVPQQAPQIPSSPSRLSLPKILLSILGVIIVLCLMGGSYYLGTQKNATIVSYQKTAVVPTKSVTVVPTSFATSTPDLTANWKTYTDASNGLSIKYPENWSYDTSLLANLKTVVFGPGNYRIPLQTESRPPIALTKKGEQYDAVVKQYVDSWRSKNQQSITIDGLSGIFISGTNTQPGPGQGFSGGAYILNQNGTAIAFSYNVINGVDYKDIAQQMMQTLKIN